MSLALRAVAVLLLTPSIGAWAQQTTLAPSYSTASILNAATNQPAYAPNSILSIYGTNLSFSKTGTTQVSGVLPTKLGGVTVYINSIPANLFFVSPTQINLLVPASLKPTPKTLQVVRDGTAGPAVSLPLAATAPGFFQLDDTNVLATHADGSVITPALPALPGETIVIYTVGLGATIPDFPDGTIPDRAAPMANPGTLGLLIDSTLVDPKTILYAGVTPGCAGLYQINLRLPDPLPSNPEIRIGVGAQVSPPGTMLPTP